LPNGGDPAKLKALKQAPSFIRRKPMASHNIQPSEAPGGEADFIAQAVAAYRQLKAWKVSFGAWGNISRIMPIACTIKLSVKQAIPLAAAPWRAQPRM
jgi:hypothetical protein